MNALRKRVLRLAAVASLGAVGLTLSPAASPAALAETAQAGSCSLSARRLTDTGYVALTLRCTPRDPADRLWKINVWGDDTFSDELITSYRLDYCATPRMIRWAVLENRLNEDLADRDEIYAGVWFKRTDGKTYGIQSNTVTDAWGFTSPPGGGFEPPLPAGTSGRPRC